MWHEFPHLPPPRSAFVLHGPRQLLRAWGSFVGRGPKRRVSMRIPRLVQSAQDNRESRNHGKFVGFLCLCGLLAPVTLPRPHLDKWGPPLGMPVPHVISASLKEPRGHASIVPKWLELRSVWHGSGCNSGPFTDISSVFRTVIEANSRVAGCTRLVL